MIIKWYELFRNIGNRDRLQIYRYSSYIEFGIDMLPYSVAARKYNSEYNLIEPMPYGDNIILEFLDADGDIIVIDNSSFDGLLKRGVIK